MSTLSSNDFSIEAFQQELLINPLKLFIKIRNHQCFEAAFFALLYTFFAKQYELLRLPDHQITLSEQNLKDAWLKVDCFAQLFIVEHAPLLLNLRKNDLSVSYFETFFQSSSHTGQYLYNTELPKDVKTLQNALYLLRQILLRLYEDKLQSVYQRYLTKAGASMPDDNGAITPRFFTASQQPKYIRPVSQYVQALIISQLKNAGFIAESYGLENFNQLFEQDKLLDEISPLPQSNHEPQGCYHCALL